MSGVAQCFSRVAALLLFCLLQQPSAPPQTTQAVPAVGAADFRISGRVLDAVSGQALAKAQVSISMANNPDAGRVELTGDDGGFVFHGVAPGKYTLSARHRGYVQQLYQQHERFSTAIVTGPGLDSENLRFELRPGASISGKVADEANDAVRHAQIMLFEQSLVAGKRRTEVTRRTTTDDQGRYHFGHLTPGAYFVGVWAEPWYAQHSFRLSAYNRVAVSGPSGARPEEQNPSLDVAYTLTFFSNANNLEGAAAITVRPGDAEIADVTLRPVPALHMLVKTAVDASQGIGVQVRQVMGDGDNSFMPVQVTYNQVAPGMIEVTGVPPGRVILGVSTPQKNSNVWASHSESVQVSENMVVDETESPRGVVVSGVLKVDDGTPVPQPARVRLRNTVSGESFDTDVAPSGEFSFRQDPVELGGYELIIIRGPGLLIRNLTSPNVKTAGRSFQISAAQDVNVTIVAAKGTAQVTGFALRDGKPVAGAMLVLVPQDLHANPALFRRDQSDSDGSFTLGGVISGKYSVVAIERGWELEWADPDVIRRYVAGGAPVELLPGGKADVVVMVQ
jgi:protocatechuate 3,4-dioxygenase beta subunit